MIARSAARGLLGLLAATALSLPSTVDARGYRIDQIPGGYVFECDACHREQPFTRLNAFGQDARRNLLFAADYEGQDLPDGFFIGDEGNVDWAALALLDSDGDGYTNGEELGDPQGAFIQFDAQPDFPFTRPDLPDDFPCGSGTIEGPEACDGEALGALSCADLGFAGGTLRCGGDCQPDPTDCDHCGDGVVDPDEACDGAPPPDAVCPPGEVGAVRCAADCTVDRSGCRAPPDAMVPDAMVPDAMVPDAMVPDAMVPDAMLPDAMLPDAMLPDAMLPDAMAPDATAPDVMLADRGEAPDHRLLDGPPSPVDPPSEPPSADGGCHLSHSAPTGCTGWAWLALALVVARRRRRSHPPST